MLILSRTEGQGIWIGKDVFVEVTEVRGDKVRLGITAPKNIAVDRKEVREAKEQKLVG